MAASAPIPRSTSSLHPPLSTKTGLSHSAPSSPLYPPSISFAQSQTQGRTPRLGGGGPNVRRSWVDGGETIKASGSGTIRPSLHTLGADAEGERNGRREDSRTQASTRTVSSHSSSSSTSETSGSSLRAEANSISSTSSSSTAIVTPRTSNLGADELQMAAPSPLSLPPLLPTPKSERRKSGFGVIKGWFGSSKKKDAPAFITRQREASGDSSTSGEFDRVSPPLTPVDGRTSAASTLGLTLQRPQEPARHSSPPRPASTASQPAQSTAKKTHCATGAIPSPSLTSPAPPPPNIPVAAPPSARSRTSSTSALPQLAARQPSLTPLQSLHLLSAQKLSIMFRPSPHPLFLSRSAAASGASPAPQRLQGAGVSPAKRFPASTNPLTRRNQQKYLGLAAEVGVRNIMRKLEEGVVVSSQETEALIHIFSARPISLVKDKTGRFVATIADPQDLDASLVDALAPTLPLVHSAASGQLGSGILAFIKRPSFQQRYTEVLPHPQVPDRTFSFDAVRPRRAKGCSRASGPAPLQFSLGLRALATEVESGQVFRTLAAKSPSTTSTTLLPTLSSGRSSPTDMVKEEPLVVVDAPLALPPIAPLKATASPAPAVKAASIRSSALSPPALTLSTATPSASPSQISSITRGDQAARSSLPVTSPLKSAMASRRSASFSGLEAHLEQSLSTSTVADDDEENDEDLVPLAAVARRQSFATLTTARASSTTPIDRPPSTPTTPVPPVPPLPSKPRGVRFSVDTEALVRATDTRLAAEAKAEKARAKQEEEERRRQERYKAEVAAARERRESSKLGQRKGNGGQYEDWNSLSRRAAAPTTIPSKASMRDLALPSAPTPQAQSPRNGKGPANKLPDSVNSSSGAHAPPSSFGPRSRSSQQLASETMSRSHSQEKMMHHHHRHRRQESTALEDLQPPSLVYDSGNSSPQTSLSSSIPPSGSSQRLQSLSYNHQRSTTGPDALPSSSRSRSSPQLKAHSSVAAFSHASSSTVTPTPYNHLHHHRHQQGSPRMMHHSRSSPAIPTVGHMGGLFPPPPPMPVAFPPSPALGHFGAYAPPYDLGFVPPMPNAFHQPFTGYGHPMHQYQPAPQAHYPSALLPSPQPGSASSTRTRRPSNMR